MIKFFKWVSIIIICLVLLVMAVGMYKFNYLSSLPGYDVDGNKIEESGNAVPWKSTNTRYSAKIGNKYFSSKYNEPNEKFLIGSITKVFTATLILQMAEHGKISLEDKASKFIDSPKLGSHVLIKSLLNHTSGIVDGDEVELFKEVYNNQYKLATHADKYQNTSYTDKKVFSYSNVNYILLGEVLEKVSGKSFKEIVTNNIIEKLKLKNTCFIGTKENCDFQKGYLNLALLGEEEKYVQLEDYTHFDSIAGSAGNIASNIEDLEALFKSIFNNEFYNSDVLKGSLVSNEYGYGIKNYGDGYYGHNGQALDTVSFAAYNPETRQVIIILIGDSSVNMNKAIEYFLAKR